jgi:hypothetical protein
VSTVTDPATEPAQAQPGRGDRFRLVALSFLLLFLELALIRWSGANIVHLSFFANFVLLGSFLGIGLGFLRANRKLNLFPYAPIVLAALVAFIRFFPVQIKSSNNTDLIYFGRLEETGLPREITLTVVFLVVAAVMAFIAEGVARTFKKFEPLDAYRLDLIGSVLGIIGISVLAFLGAPPLVWGAVAGVGIVYFAFQGTARPIQVLQVLSLVAIVVMLAFESFAGGVRWSPYYKIETETSAALDGQSLISVNGVSHQANLESTENPLYNAVYDQLAKKRLDNVLIIGAGGGNDVSVALAQGAKHVDAVEIDRELQQLGEETHPDKPYDDPRVDVHINDGRAFLESTDTKYDLILFALPDSITLVPGQASVRLESFLFTTEALEAAKERLKPDGVFSMYNYYREDWLLDRFANELEQVFGNTPCLESFGDVGKLAVLVDASRQRNLNCASEWAAAGVVPEESTDDHPFPYLRTRSLPSLYTVTILLILAASLILVRLVGGPLKTIGGYLDLFFMGVAFLLLETKSVVQFALLFGTTWFVNALVFLGILVTVLIAVEISRRVTFKRPAWLYLVLLATIAVAWAIEPGSLLSLSPVPRFLAAVAIAFAPILIANLVFTQRFKDVGSSTTAFGANLLGAMVGGVLEYIALITGYRMLLLVVALAYGAAFFFGRSHLARRRAVPVG